MGEQTLSIIVAFNEAHEAWKGADPDRARDLLRECANLQPDDKTVQLYLKRLEECAGDAEKMREFFKAEYETATKSSSASSKASS